MKPTQDPVKRAKRRDKDYFKRHPDIKRYCRARIQGEFGDAEGQYPEDRYNAVEVTSLAPGICWRDPFWLIRASDYPAGKIPLEHIEMAIEQALSTGGEWRLIGDDELDDLAGDCA